MADVDEPAGRPPEVCPGSGAPADTTGNDVLRALRNSLEAVRKLAGQPNESPQMSQPADELVKWIGNPAELDQHLEQVLAQSRQVVPDEPAVVVNGAERRSAARRKLTSLICATVDSTNGGILLNLSKRGLAIRVIDFVMDGQHVELSFSLPPAAAPIQTCGKVAWTDTSRHTAGIRFVELPAAAGERLEAWLSDGVLPGSGAAVPRSLAATGEMRTPDTVESMPSCASAEKPGPPQPESRDQSDSAIEGLGERSPRDLNGHGKWMVSGIIVGLVAIIIIAIAFESPALSPLLRSRDARGFVDLVSRLFRDEVPPVPAVRRPAIGTEKTEKADRRPAANRTTLSRQAEKASVGQPEKSQPVQTTRAFPEVEVQGSSEWRLIRDPAAQAVPASVSAGRRQFQVSYEFSGPAPKNVVLPPYPGQARQNGLEGAVIVRAVVETDGRLGKIRVVSGDPTLAAAVESSIKAWRYEEGKPSTETRITVNFTIANQ